MISIQKFLSGGRPAAINPIWCKCYAGKSAVNYRYPVFIDGCDCQYEIHDLHKHACECTARYKLAMNAILQTNLSAKSNQISNIITLASNTKYNSLDDAIAAIADIKNNLAVYTDETVTISKAVFSDGHYLNSDGKYTVSVSVFKDKYLIRAHTPSSLMDICIHMCRKQPPIESKFKVLPEEVRERISRGPFA